ncbi:MULTISPECIES: hypothetical protein [unclassified Luteococcus]|uniref:hypothetical protein n=1 Tax=unclassified Luteococcus TaxID=2639923 RepID=UPI00313EC6A6
MADYPSNNSRDDRRRDDGPRRDDRGPGNDRPSREGRGYRGEDRRDNRSGGYSGRPSQDRGGYRGRGDDEGRRYQSSGWTGRSEGRDQERGYRRDDDRPRSERGRGYGRDDERPRGGERGYRGEGERSERGGERGYSRRPEQGRGYGRDDERPRGGERGYRGEGERSERGGERGYSRRPEQGRGYGRDDERPRGGERGYRREDDRPRGDERGRGYGRDDRRGGSGRGEVRRDFREDRPRRDEENFVRPGLAARADEPPTPEDVDEKELPFGVRAELKGLPKDLGQIVAAHLVAAGQLIDEDPELAYRHAEAARRRAARLPVVREATAETAYAAGEYAVALNEYRALRRMTGGAEYLPVMADCERALGRAEAALKLAKEAAEQRLDATQRVEMLLVEAGARDDLGQRPEALRLLKNAIGNKAVSPQGQARLRYAYADLLERSDQPEAAKQWFASAAKYDAEGLLDTEDRLNQLDGFVLEFDESEDDEEDEGAVEPVAEAPKDAEDGEDEGAREAAAEAPQDDEDGTRESHERAEQE